MDEVVVVKGSGGPGPSDAGFPLRDGGDLAAATKLTLAPGTYPVTVGAGGAGATGGGPGLAGGSISALGLLMGAFIIVLIKNGLVMLEANVYYEQAFLGSIILLAVVVSRVRDIYSERLKD